MFRPGKNPKDQTHAADETADHTPQSSSSYGGSTGTNPAGGGQSATDAYQSSVHTPTTTRAVTESESLARDIKEGTLTGFVGNGTSLDGEASFKGMLRVDGHLKGRVSSSDGTLIVSTNGVVDANVEVAVAQIQGTINGDIFASKRVELGRVAKVKGNITTPALVIDSGAIFNGLCTMVQDASDKQSKKDETGAATSSTSPSSPSSASSSTGAPTSSSSSAPSSSSSSSAYTSPKTKTGDAADVPTASDIAS